MKNTKRTNAFLEAEVKFIETCRNAAHELQEKTKNDDAVNLAASFAAMGEDFLVGCCTMLDEDRVDDFLEDVKKSAKAKYIFVEKMLKSQSPSIH